MRDWHPLSKILLIFGLIGLGLTWWLDGDDLSPSVQATGSINKTAVASTTSINKRPVVRRALTPLETFTAIIERPLFAPTRRPPPKIESSELLPEAELLFHGHFIGSIEDSDGLRALLSNGGGLQSVARGEEIQGWTAIEVDRRRLLLNSGERFIEFVLFR